MNVPCVRVPREAGEPTRRRLAERGVLAAEYEIALEDGELYLPLAADADPTALPAEFDVVHRDVPARETQTLPRDLLEDEPTYERLGSVAILDEDDPDRAREIADAIAAADLPIETVIDRASPVEGDRRLRDFEVLVGDSTETVHREYGCGFELDLRRVYFSARLATERHRVIEQVAPEERVFDMFAGVGPFVVPAAVRGATAVGTDLNPDAIAYLRRNAERNGVEDRVTAIEGDVRDVTGYADWADRVVMNLPHRADEYLETAVALASSECVLHYYDIQPDEDPFAPGERAIRDAAGGYDVAIETRRVVRSYAPHESNVCIDARLTR